MELRIDGATIEVVGQLDARSTPEIRDALHDVLAMHPGDVVLDLSGVESVDLTALRMIAVASRAAQLERHGLRLRGCPVLVRRLLHLTRLRTLVTFEDDYAPA